MINCRDFWLTNTPIFSTIWRTRSRCMIPNSDKDCEMQLATSLHLLKKLRKRETVLRPPFERPRPPACGIGEAIQAGHHSLQVPISGLASGCILRTPAKAAGCGHADCPVVPKCRTYAMKTCLTENIVSQMSSLRILPQTYGHVRESGWIPARFLTFLGLSYVDAFRRSKPAF